MCLKRRLHGILSKESLLPEELLFSLGKENIEFLKLLWKDVLSETHSHAIQESVKADTAKASMPVSSSGQAATRPLVPAYNSPRSVTAPGDVTPIQPSPPPGSPPSSRGFLDQTFSRDPPSAGVGPVDGSGEGVNTFNTFQQSNIMSKTTGMMPSPPSSARRPISPAAHAYRCRTAPARKHTQRYGGRSGLSNAWKHSKRSISALTARLGKQQRTLRARPGKSWIVTAKESLSRPSTHHGGDTARDSGGLGLAGLENVLEEQSTQGRGSSPVDHFPSPPSSPSPQPSPQSKPNRPPPAPANAQSSNVFIAPGSAPASTSAGSAGGARHTSRFRSGQRCSGFQSTGYIHEIGAHGDGGLGPSGGAAGSLTIPREDVYYPTLEQVCIYNISRSILS